MVCKYKFLHQFNTNDHDLLVLDKFKNFSVASKYMMGSNSEKKLAD